MTADTTQLAEISGKLAFSKKLQEVTNKVHAAHNLDEIMLDVAREIRVLFDADRITIYHVSDDRKWVVTKIKTGLENFTDLKLPISPQSIAGYCAFTKRLLNIKDVYDDAELKSYTPEMRFLKEVDQRTGYRTKQMLVAPILDDDGSAMGVIQLINTLSGLPFSDIATEGATEIAKTLAIAFNQRKAGPAGLAAQQPVRTKYDDLIKQGLVSADELVLALRSARKKGRNLEDILIEEFQIARSAIGNALASFYGVAYEAYKADRIKPADLLKNLKREYLESEGWIPLDDTAEGLIVLALDPENLKGTRTTNQIFPKSKIVYRVCTAHEFKQTLDLFYGAESDTGSISDMLSALEEGGDEEGGLGVEDISAAQDNELVQLVNKIIIDAYKQGASDIHIEPGAGKNKTLVRFRRDGSLVPYIELPWHLRNPLVARLKIMCDLDIAEKRKPQDGKIQFKKFGPLNIELRVATVPTAGGLEDVVMRILAAGEPIPIDKLGLSRHNLTHTKDLVSKPYGLFLVCGPTGSGKTTTLHSVLGFINTPDTKIWTAEDPVEITQKGLRQVQVNPKTGFTFAIAMRAFLRADPDVVMVGEMRDAETVETGIEASLTGHMVFSTLHTNSAPESIVRLLDMGMDPFNFADALLGILAQRLGKRLCSKCKKAYTPDQKELDDIVSEYSLELTRTSSWAKDPAAARKQLLEQWRKEFGNDKGEFTLYQPVGCPECNNSGYKGRVGLHELLVCTDPIKKQIQEKARVAEVLATALEEGMRTLKQDGIEKVMQGITDLHQVRAVCIK